MIHALAIIAGLGIMAQTSPAPGSSVATPTSKAKATPESKSEICERNLEIAAIGHHGEATVLLNLAGTEGAPYSDSMFRTTRGSIQRNLETTQELIATCVAGPRRDALRAYTIAFRGMVKHVDSAYAGWNDDLNQSDQLFASCVKGLAGTPIGARCATGAQDNARLRARWTQ